MQTTFDPNEPPDEFAERTFWSEPKLGRFTQYFWTLAPHWFYVKWVSWFIKKIPGGHVNFDEVRFALATRLVRHETEEWMVWVEMRAVCEMFQRQKDLSRAERAYWRKLEQGFLMLFREYQHPPRG